MIGRPQAWELAPDELLDELGRLHRLQRHGDPHLRQQVVLWLLTDPEAQGLVHVAEETYAARRDGMLRALAARGLPAKGRSGLNVWVPVADEGRTVQVLLQAGWAVRAGARFRMASPPGVRITIATVQVEEAERLADALARSVEGERRTGPA